MTIKRLVEKYIKKTQQALRQIDIRKSGEGNQRVNVVLDYAARYLKDAIYYSDQEKFETALGSIAYSEGLLDALRLLQLVKFQWLKKDKLSKDVP